MNAPHLSIIYSSYLNVNGSGFIKLTTADVKFETKTSVKIPYDHRIGDVLKQTEAILKHNGFKIIGFNQSLTSGYIVVCEFDRNKLEEFFT